MNLKLENKEGAEATIIEDPDRTVEDDHDDEYLEISRNNRYEKRPTKINLLNGSKDFFCNIANDLYSGREVLWNRLDLKKNMFSDQEKESIKSMLDHLSSIKQHPFISKFLSYWIKDKTETIFSIYMITENFGTMSLNKFLKSINSNVSFISWQTWCLQLALGINFLHSCEPPIIHGCINAKTIYFDSRGVIKLCFIGMHSRNFFDNYKFVELEKSNQPKPFDYVAQEYKHKKVLESPLDIFDFGLVALQIASKNMNYDESTFTPYKLIGKGSNIHQKSLLRKCLKFFPIDRPTSLELLTHKALFCFPTLKSLIIEKFHASEEMMDNFFDLSVDPDTVVITIVHTNKVLTHKEFKKSINRELIDSIKCGNECALVLKKHLNKIAKLRLNPHNPNISKKDSKPGIFTNKYEKETRTITGIECSIDPSSLILTILIDFDGKTNRQLTTNITLSEKGIDLAEDLVSNSLIGEEDLYWVAEKIQAHINKILVSDQLKV